MPELPDLVILEKRLQPMLVGQAIVRAEIHKPVILRMLIPGGFNELMPGAEFTAVRRHGPFMLFSLSNNTELIIHPMLAGRFQFIPEDTKSGPAAAMSLHLEPSHDALHYLDDKKMGKVYLIANGQYERIPRFIDQGPDLLSPQFTLEYFDTQIRRSRKQVRVLLMDQSVLSCIGNAYADEILFSAGIHPKTFCHQIARDEIEKLHCCIIDTMKWGIEQVESARQPTEVKVRDHMRVRNRKDEPCPKCGTKIRRAGVLGYDSFFCPNCQPLKRGQFIDWRELRQ